MRLRQSAEVVPATRQPWLRKAQSNQIGSETRAGEDLTFFCTRHTAQREPSRGIPARSTPGDCGVPTLELGVAVNDVDRPEPGPPVAPIRARESGGGGGLPPAAASQLPPSLPLVVLGVSTSMASSPSPLPSSAASSSATATTAPLASRPARSRKTSCSIACVNGCAYSSAGASPLSHRWYPPRSAVGLRRVHPPPSALFRMRSGYPVTNKDCDPLLCVAVVGWPWARRVDLRHNSGRRIVRTLLARASPPASCPAWAAWAVHRCSPVSMPVQCMVQCWSSHAGA